mmetsp:Transcript_41789/g.75222  ORF Transcript_41789/g.75222 Transcript_41789/m.75222 type:complete len:347 (+) Transcript_41789:353-1393(+)
MKLLLSSLFIIQVPANLIETDVIIIGAGAAGLSAAKNLVDRREGHKITILEATARIGGRVFSKTLGSTRVDMGAEEHYDTTGENPIYDAITSCYGTEIYEEGFTGTDVYAMTTNAADTCASITYDTSELPNCADDEDWVKYSEIWTAYLRAPFKWSNTTLANELASAKKFRVEEGVRGWHLYNNEFALEYATSVDQLGARSLALQDATWSLSEKSYWNVEKDVGYEDALNNIWWNETIANPAVTLVKESPVTSIDSSADDSFVMVEDSKNNVYKAKHVIITASIAVLKSGAISFTPTLPKDTSEAIGNIGMDQGMKVAMRFEKPWWESATGDPNLTWMVTQGPASG